MKSPMPYQELLWGRVLRPDTNRIEDVLLIRARCYGTSSSLDGTVSFSRWRAWFALGGPELADMPRISGLDISLSGFSEANRPSPSKIDFDNPSNTFRSELIGSAQGMNLHSVLIASQQNGSGYRNSSWESVLRLEIDEEISVLDGPKHAVAVLSAYSVLSGKYALAHWLALATGEADTLSRRWGAVYGGLGVIWTASNAEPYRDGPKLERAEDKAFMANWLRFFFEQHRIAVNMFETLQFASLARTGTLIDRAGMLVRLGYLSEVLYELSRSFPIGPKEAKKNRLLEQLKSLVAQLRFHLSCNILEDEVLDYWKELRHMSAHPKEGSHSHESTWRAITQWIAVLDAWLLMYLGASKEAARLVLQAGELVYQSGDGGI